MKKSVSSITPNQIVATNLRTAREHRGWTQEEAAEQLEPYLGVLWSKSSFSLAESSAKGERIRNFSADDIVAFATAFELPVSWFFVPIDERAIRTFPDEAGDGKLTDVVAMLMTLVSEQDVLGRVAALMRSLPTDVRQRVAREAKRKAGSSHKTLELFDLAAEAVGATRLLAEALEGFRGIGMGMPPIAGKRNARQPHEGKRRDAKRTHQKETKQVGRGHRTGAG